jgi:hypothetical protein
MRASSAPPSLMSAFSTTLLVVAALLGTWVGLSVL